jgi:hypothetical protein
MLPTKNLEWEVPVLSPRLGLLAAMVGGILFIALIYDARYFAFASRQIKLFGMEHAINILMFGVPGFWSGALFLSSGSTAAIYSIEQHLLPRRVPIFIAVRARSNHIGMFCYRTAHWGCASGARSAK